jgi:AAA family ATP:ADP antiporter
VAEPKVDSHNPQALAILHLSAIAPTAPPPRGPLDRFLRVFADVRDGEGGQVLLLALNVFLILTAYYVMKPVREALILVEPGGAELKSYATALQAVLLAGLVPAYGALAARLPRRQLINVVTACFIACLPVFYFAAEAGVHVGVAFFLWIGVFSLMVTAQFWAYANDLYTTEAGKRLFALIAFGASSGAVFGAFISSHLIGALGVAPLLLVAVVILAASLALFNVIDLRTRSTGTATAREAAAQPGISHRNAFALVLRSRYLLLIAALVFLVNWVNTTGEYVLSSIVKHAAEADVAAGRLAPEQQGAFIGAFFADYFEVVNLAGMLLQLFVVSRLVKHVGVPVALCILPVIAFGVYFVAALIPSLAIVRWAKTTERAVDYSLQNTVAQMLYLPTAREEKYKAKQVTDTFVVRAGDVAASATVFVGSSVLALAVAQFATINVALAAVWLGVALLLGREFRSRAAPNAGGSARTELEAQKVLS